MSTNNELATVIAALLAAAQTTPAEAASSQATLLTVAETVEILRCGQTTVYQLIKDGRLASVKIGRRRLVPASAVEEFIQRGGAAA